VRDNILIPAPIQAGIGEEMDDYTTLPEHCDEFGPRPTSLVSAKVQVHSDDLDDSTYAAVFDECFDHDLYFQAYAEAGSAQENLNSSGPARHESINNRLMAKQGEVDSTAVNVQGNEVSVVLNQQGSSLATIPQPDKIASPSIERQDSSSPMIPEQKGNAFEAISQQGSPSLILPEQDDERFGNESLENNLGASFDNSCAGLEMNDKLVLEGELKVQTSGSTTDPLQLFLSDYERPPSVSGSRVTELVASTNYNQQQLGRGSQTAIGTMTENNVPAIDFQPHYSAFDGAGSLSRSLGNEFPSSISSVPFVCPPVSWSPALSVPKSGPYSQNQDPLQDIPSLPYQEFYQPSVNRLKRFSERGANVPASTVSNPRGKRPRSETPDPSAKRQKIDLNGIFKNNGAPSARTQVKYLKDFFRNKYSQEMQRLSTVPQPDTIHRRKAARINMFSASEKAKFLLFVTGKLKEEGITTAGIVDDEGDDDFDNDLPLGTMSHTRPRAAAASGIRNSGRAAPVPATKRQMQPYQEFGIKQAGMRNKAGGLQRNKKTLAMDSYSGTSSSIGPNTPFTYQALSKNEGQPAAKFQLTGSSIGGLYHHGPNAFTPTTAPSPFPFLPSPSHQSPCYGGIVHTPQRAPPAYPASARSFQSPSFNTTGYAYSGLEDEPYPSSLSQLRQNRPLGAIDTNPQHNYPDPSSGNGLNAPSMSYYRRPPYGGIVGRNPNQEPVTGTVDRGCYEYDPCCEEFQQFRAEWLDSER
jgi:hypothetical protein